MKQLVRPLLFFLLLFLAHETMAQFNRGNPYGRYGRQRNTIPQAQTPPPEPEALTAEEIVDGQMSKIKETLGLDPFEEAVVRSTLVKYVQKRMELQILKLEPQKMKEEYQKIAELQNEELKAGLPDEKYQAYLKMMENPNKAERESKKRKKKKKKKS